MASRSAYRPHFADDAVAFFVTLPKRRQRRLLERAAELARDPFVVPDFESADETGRTISHLAIDGFLFDYWVDHAVRIVFISLIEDAE